MTAKQMIKELKKFPPNTKVAILDFDHSGELEGGSDSLSWNGPVEFVIESPDGVKDRGYGICIK